MVYVEIEIKNRKEEKEMETEINNIHDKNLIDKTLYVPPIDLSVVSCSIYLTSIEKVKQTNKQTEMIKHTTGSVFESEGVIYMMLNFVLFLC